MEPIQLCFVEGRPRKQSQRAKELVYSTIRAHNAKVAHAKRSKNAAAQTVGPPSTSTEPLITRFRIAPSSGRDRERQPAEDEEALKRARDIARAAQMGHFRGKQWLYAMLHRQWMDAIWTPFSPHVPKHIAIYQQMIVPTIQLAFEVFHVRNTHNYEFLLWMTRPTTSGYHAGAAGLQLLYDQQVSPGCGQTRQCLSHKVQASAILRETLSQSPTRVPDDELLVILSLATVERTVDLEVHQYHLETLSKIITAQGGMHLVADHPQCTILQFDAWWSLSTGLRYFSSPLSLPQPEAEPETLSARFRDQIREVPMGFHHFILAGKWSLSTVEILIRLAYVYHRGKLERDAAGRIVGLPNTARPVWRTFQEACPALDAPGASREKLLALALVLYCGIGFDSAPVSSNGGLASRGALTKILTADELPSESPEEESFLFWVWMVTICAWHNASGSGFLPPGIDLLLRLRRRFADVEDWKAAKEILEGFFWNEKLSELCRLKFEEARS
ncbi:uncharacterized protein PV07_11902 [Cladophialophora immunda]|uniref:Transcription factor domain-containing protein n=1 Tax=Cladophialophora immunda TaxID=569365 RepID=A0A0D2CJH8_9EURO|nr:uncharacterized protein PV07_11902 [Cladophialophora immunda]KIW23724.1 hypothetical protein PV07_11902 [Cladophialophora immunda]OQV03351.1 hypothetical protein CLAIMM_08403 [Cladophialophora immunda]